ncbi:ferrous iron transport protein A [Brachybacterium sp. NBEC-018]|nr:ferrous iron transport protein A [Brachybacterium sp. NBEC-018]
MSDADPAVLQRARELGVVPGAELEIELGGGPDGTRAVRAPGGAPLEVGAELAAATLVVPSGPTA